MNKETVKLNQASKLEIDLLKEGNNLSLIQVVLTLNKEQVESMSKEDYSAGNVQFLIAMQTDGSLMISA